MLLWSYLLKHLWHQSWTALFCHTWLIGLVLVLFMPHSLFEQVPLFSLLWLVSAVCWFVMASFLDHVPLISTGGHQYPDVALEEAWELTAVMMQFFQKNERDLFEGPTAALYGMRSPKSLCLSRYSSFQSPLPRSSGLADKYE
jgi:hypothetical protein